MQRVIPRSNYRPIRVTKQWAKLINKVESELNTECNTQMDLVMCSAMIALNRYWGWKTERLSNLNFMQQAIWDECGSDNNMSMIRMLDEECDIELTNQEGKSYREVIYLNAEIDTGKPLSNAQWVAMRQNQTKWVAAQITACVLLALHRKEGWGAKRVGELLDRMDDIKIEFDYSPEKIVEALWNEAKYDWTGIHTPQEG